MIRVVLMLCALAACGDNLHNATCGDDGVDAMARDAMAPDAAIDAETDCRLPPCGEPTAAWDTWAARCFAVGECRLVTCPLMGDNLVHVCRPGTP